ncbi:ATP-binding protein [Haloarchaeobius sp. DFWS5]|uniref:ATP-binding protein n=1 Tax=Haloarchaeobius sp. DFWS5 TaxID=3446114 RepID=UPI003EB7F5AD
MTFVTTLVAIALDVGAVALLGWTTWTAADSRQKPIGPAFVAVLGILTVWALFSLGSELPIVPDQSLLSTGLAFAELSMALLLPGVWVVYARSYTGRGTGLTRWRILMLVLIAVPVVVVAVVIAAGLPESAITYTAASMVGMELFYLVGLFVYGAALLVGLGLRHTRVSKRQVAVVTFGVGAPYIVAVAWPAEPASKNVSIGLLVAGVLLAVAVQRYPVMTGFPKSNYVARTRVVEGLREAVVVLDWEDHVIDANDATGAVFDCSAATLVGEPIRSTVPELDQHDLAVGATGTVRLQTTNGRRQFQYSVSAVDSAEHDGDSGSSAVARAVLFRDVTDQQAREQRLAVLHRVLRHNVRNKLDVVLAHADLVEDEQLQRGIRESATDLVALSNKARAAEEIMTASTESPTAVDLTAVVATVVDQYRNEVPDSDITHSCPDELTVSTHRSVVERILSELVENALTHSDEATPSVHVSVQHVEDAAVELSVADDGPGIPERERRILAAGTETKLEHGQGIGLWFVNWAVRQLGGDLTFGDNDPAGSVVTVRLYGATAGSDSVD